MNDRRIAKRLVVGAAAGFIGTLALQGLRTASQRWLPASLPPIRQDPGEVMVEQVAEVLPTRDVPALAKTAMARSLAVGYGLTTGALYAALRPTAGNVIGDGFALGLGVWVVGYLGWLPALKFMLPLREQSLQEVVGPAVRHAFFGVATVAAYRWWHKRAKQNNR